MGLRVTARLIALTQARGYDRAVEGKLLWDSFSDWQFSWDCFEMIVTA
jgi:hypothetical protein